MDAQVFGRPPGPIGVFGTPPDEEAARASPLYLGYELFHAALQPARLLAAATRCFYSEPLNPLATTPFGRATAAGAELFERATRRYTKPAFGLGSTGDDGAATGVTEEVAWQGSFCRLLHFRKEAAPPQPRVLVVAPMSGHFATLVRGTVRALLPAHDVYVTDWADARMVPLGAGRFDLDDYVDYLIEIFGLFGGDLHVMAVCQPAVPVLMATALLEAAGDPRAPRSMVLMGGPIDTRINPTAVNRLAEERGLDWFRTHAIAPVPPPHPGAGRLVYPGFLQLGGFVAMNLDRHLSAHWHFFEDLVEGDGDSAARHRAFYDEYLAVMDLTAEFYLQTVDQVFIRHALPKGELVHRGVPVRPDAIRRAALMTVEGERDDISGVGHYGVFNGTRFEAETLPEIAAFIRMAEAA
jgi:poly(3-hydroxybutyrate) depolymerase